MQVPGPDTVPVFLAVAGSGATSTVPAGVVNEIALSMNVLTFSPDASANEPPHTSSARTTRAPGGMRRIACDRLRRQSLVVPNGKSGDVACDGDSSSRLGSVVMNVALGPRVPWPFGSVSPSRPSAFPVNVTTPFVVAVNR